MLQDSSARRLTPYRGAAYIGAKWNRAGLQTHRCVVWNKVVFTLICLVVPVAWGVLVNWLFHLWQNRGNDSSQDDSIFPDYQI